MDKKAEMNRIYELRQQINKLRAELGPLEEAQKQEQNSKYVGRCFKFNNSYGSGERWYLYARIIDAGDYWPTGVTFQHTSSDTIEIRTDKGMTSLESWEEISLAEYQAAWKQIMADVAKVANLSQREEV